MDIAEKKRTRPEELAQKTWLTVEQAAEYSGIGRTRLYGFLRRNELRSAKIGSRRHVRRTDLDSFMASFIQGE